MKHDAHQQDAGPFDFRTVMGVEVLPYTFAEDACRAWLDGAQFIQAEVAEFINVRAGKGMAALTEWTRCRTSADALEMQTRYASEALADYVVGGQRMWKLVAAAAQPLTGAGK